MPEANPKTPQIPPVKMPDYVALSRAMVEIGGRSARVMQDFIARQTVANGPPPADAAHITDAFLKMTQKLMQQPARLMEAGMSLWQDYMKLWQNTAQRLMSNQPQLPVIAPEKGDKRFSDAAWSENALFDYIKQSYLLSARWIQSIVEDTQGLDDKTAQKVEFYTRQFVDAMSPTNFVMTNPEVLRRTAETGGENLIKGLENLLKDLERGKGELRIAMTDENAFEVGKNLAVTPGKVVYQNDLMQLIQYAPQTDQVKRVPFLIVPPWINKYYILDLNEKKSFARWLVKQGYTVFMISWVNPDATLAEKSFGDYLVEGPVEALRQIKKITGEDSVNTNGYCLGGTLLASTLAWLEAKKGQPDVADVPKVASATFMASMLDFRDPGEITVFIDEAQLRSLEDHMEAQGYLEGKTMATTFNLLRANDLIWSFVINNYMLGKEPFPFDLLYWNGDSTRMPAAMHSFYLREMYQKNRLIKPGAVAIAGASIDMTQITTPSFFLSTKEDHISPWRTTYWGAKAFKGPVKFVLSGSGHIAGVVNPPEAKKYGYWTNDAADLPGLPDEWMKGAQAAEGSWWLEWDKWLSAYSGDNVPARKVTRGLEDAPGSYVKVMAN